MKQNGRNFDKFIKELSKHHKRWSDMDLTWEAARKCWKKTQAQKKKQLKNKLETNCPKATRNASKIRANRVKNAKQKPSKVSPCPSQTEAMECGDVEETQQKPWKDPETVVKPTEAKIESMDIKPEIVKSADSPKPKKYDKSSDSSSDSEKLDDCSDNEIKEGWNMETEEKLDTVGGKQTCGQKPSKGGKSAQKCQKKKPQPCGGKNKKAEKPKGGKCKAKEEESEEDDEEDEDDDEDEEEEEQPEKKKDRSKKSSCCSVNKSKGKCKSNFNLMTSISKIVADVFKMIGDQYHGKGAKSKCSSSCSSSPSSKQKSKASCSSNSKTMPNTLSKNRANRKQRKTIKKAVCNNANTENKSDHSSNSSNNSNNNKNCSKPTKASRKKK